MLEEALIFVDDLAKCVKQVRGGRESTPAESILIDCIYSKVFGLAESNLPAASVEEKDKQVSIAPIAIDPHIQSTPHDAFSKMLKCPQVDIELLAWQRGVFESAVNDIGSSILVALQIFDRDLFAQEIGLAWEFEAVLFGVAKQQILGLALIDRLLDAFCVAVETVSVVYEYL